MIDYKIVLERKEMVAETYENYLRLAMGYERLGDNSKVAEALLSLERSEGDIVDDLLYPLVATYWWRLGDKQKSSEWLSKINIDNVIKYGGLPLYNLIQYYLVADVDKAHQLIGTLLKSSNKGEGVCHYNLARAMFHAGYDYKAIFPIIEKFEAEIESPAQRHLTSSLYFMVGAIDKAIAPLQNDIEVNVIDHDLIRTVINGLIELDEKDLATELLCQSFYTERGVEGIQNGPSIKREKILASDMKYASSMRLHDRFKSFYNFVCFSGKLTLKLDLPTFAKHLEEIVLNYPQYYGYLEWVNCAEVWAMAENDKKAMNCLDRAFDLRDETFRPFNASNIWFELDYLNLKGVVN